MQKTNYLAPESYVITVKLESGILGSSDHRIIGNAGNKYGYGDRSVFSAGSGDQEAAQDI